MNFKDEVINILKEGKNYLDEDNKLEQKMLDFENYLKSNKRFSDHEKNILKKLMKEVKSAAFSSGYANHRFDSED